MPTYDYLCRACGHRFEQFQNITARRLSVCPACKARKLERQIGAGGALIFKGSGFYQTDYRSESYKQQAAADGKPAAGGTETAKAAKAAKPARKPSGRSQKPRPESAI